MLASCQSRYRYEMVTLLLPRVKEGLKSVIRLMSGIDMKTLAYKLLETQIIMKLQK